MGYADNLALVIEGRTEADLTDRAEYALKRVSEHLEGIGLTVEETKTEVVILEGRRTLTSIRIRVGEESVTSSLTVKYLGVYLDKDLRMTEHVRRVAEKAAKIQNNLSRLMPRLGGPSQHRRRMLATVVASVVLYAAPAWESALRHKKYVHMLRNIERRYAIAVTSAYRTVATEAVGVLAICPPLDLMARERSFNWQTRGQRAAEARRQLLTTWQERWDEYKG